ncbi:YadA-like family protein [Paraburkholderia caribensis]|uniref:YadA-like family protein n=1 Tax=Paraburkholderia caribensis TaxID=75105 RepID=UPI001CAED2D2|nr:YadA-like family protein [Paraburkholderia caribensis]CAG9269400.1 Hemagluttinin/autotransporter adhesin [Paraburkholderia caribensis]
MTKYRRRNERFFMLIGICSVLTGTNAAFADTKGESTSDALLFLKELGGSEDARQVRKQDSPRQIVGTPGFGDWRNGNVTDGWGSRVIEPDSKARGHDGVAIGHNAEATSGNVAIGASSSTRANLLAAPYNPGFQNLEGATAKGEVSLGSKDKERRITNLAAGASQTDAVNISQLAALSGKLDKTAASVTTAFGGGAIYEASTGTFSTPRYQVGDKTFSDVGSAITALDNHGQNFAMIGVAYTDTQYNEVRLRGKARITNVEKGKIGEGSSDAVNGAQLWSTENDVSKLNGAMNHITDGGGIKFFRVNGNATEKDGLKPGDSQATAAGSVAIGGGAVASGAGGVALGAFSKATAAGAVAIGRDSVADRENTVSVGSSARDGHVSIKRKITNVAPGTEDTDAVNVGQLKKTGLVDTEGRTQGAVVYDNASTRSSVLLGGINALEPVKITNLAAGRVSEGSSDAVNGGQLFELTGRVDTLEKRSDVSKGQVHPTGSRVVADQVDGGGRRIAHVDAGVTDTDAANVAQLNSAVDAGVGKAKIYTDEQIGQVRSQMDHNRKDASGGSASAIAVSNLPQAYPGENMVSVAGGAFDGQSAVALGLSTSTQKLSVKASLTANTRGSYGGGAGVGYRF